MFILFRNLEFSDVRKHYDVCYFVLEMFVMMENISDICFLCLMLFTLLYFIIR